MDLDMVKWVKSNATSAEGKPKPCIVVSVHKSGSLSSKQSFSNEIYISGALMAKAKINDGERCNVGSLVNDNGSYLVIHRQHQGFKVLCRSDGLHAKRYLKIARNTNQSELPFASRVEIFDKDVQISDGLILARCKK
jgi:hypothetical protein